MPLSIHLTDDEQRRFDALAAKAGRSADEIIHEAIQTQLEELEDAAWGEQAGREWEASDKSTTPLGDIRRELGL